MGAQTRAATPLVVQWVCVICGRPFALAGGTAGTEIPDRVAFLDAHEDCLRESFRRDRAQPGP